MKASYNVHNISFWDKNRFLLDFPLTRTVAQVFTARQVFWLFFSIQGAQGSDSLSS